MGEAKYMIGYWIPSDLDNGADLLPIGVVAWSDSSAETQIIALEDIAKKHVGGNGLTSSELKELRQAMKESRSVSEYISSPYFREVVSVRFEGTLQGLANKIFEEQVLSFYDVK